MARRVASLLLIVFLAVSLCFAQRPGGQPPPPPNPSGRPSGMPSPLGTGVARSIELVVHVVLPNDRPAGESISVTVEAATGGVVAQYFTNSEGQVRFPNIAPGSYVIRVRGADVKETASEILNLQSYDSFHTEYIHVQPLQDDATAVKSKDGSVSATELNIPAKARKEFDKGTEAYAKGDYKKALELYGKAVEIYPKYATAYNNMGAVYMKSGDKAKAREVWLKALEADENLITANCNLARLDIMDHEFAAAIPFLQKALAIQPNAGEALLLMSEAQLMTGDFDKALLYARKVHAGEHQKLEMAHIVAGRALEQQNHPDLARAEYQTLLQEAPASKEAVEARASIARLEQTAKKQ